MIRYSDTVNDRKVFYLSLQDSLEKFEVLNLTDWAVFIIEDNVTNPLLETFASMCIDKEVLYMTATGKACSSIDDLFDEIMVIRRLQGSKLPSWMKSDEDVLMTTWDYDLAEGFWYITSVANYRDLSIKTVLVVDFTATDHSEWIEELIVNINKGWLPPD